MTVLNHRRTSALIGSALATLAAVTILPTGASAAGITTLSAQTAYNCEVNTPPPPPEDYSGSVTASIQFTVPSSVYPGEILNLSGTLTLQFPENLRAAAIVYGDTSVQGVSTTLNLGVDAAGQSTDVFADEWQTPPTQIGNPMQVSGVLTMPPLTVPKNATGIYELQMPENGVTPNTAESSPATVAFTAVATATGSNGQTPIKLACYLPGSSPELGQIPIVAAPVAAASTGASKSTATKSSAASTVSAAKSSTATKASAAKSASGTTKAAGATQAGTTKAAVATPAAGTTKAAGTTQASGAGAVVGATGATAVTGGGVSVGSSGSSGSGSGGGVTAGDTGVAASESSGASGDVTPSGGAIDVVGTPASSATSTRSGVYVSAPLLVLGGFLICLASIAYALLTRYRLNSIRRELDD